MITVKNLIIGINSYFVGADYAESGSHRWETDQFCPDTVSP